MRLLDKQQLDHLLIQRSFALRNDDMHAVMKQLRTKKWKYVTDGNDFAAICSPKFETRTQLKKYVQQFIDIYAARVEDRQLDFITD